jgi:hypothetical protein
LIRIVASVSSARRSGSGTVTSGAVRADQAGPAGGGLIDPGVGRAASGAPEDGAAGFGQRGSAAAQADLSRPRPAIGPYAAIIDGWLIADQQVPREQRHTARRIWQRLVAEHSASLAEVTVSRYVAGRRVELGLDQVEVAVPQSHLPGAEAEVDFAEFYAAIAGALVKLWMFVMRLLHSGRAFHVAFATQAQEAFLEGHVLAFEYFGAVPGRVRCDNLTSAVVSVLKGRDRDEAERFIALRSHYGSGLVLLHPRESRGARERRRGG